LQVPKSLSLNVNERNVGEAIYKEPQKRPAMLAEVIQSHDWKRYEVLYRRKDDSSMLATLTIRAATEQDGKTYLTGFIEDITERRKAEDTLIMKWAAPASAAATGSDVGRIHERDHAISVLKKALLSLTAQQNRLTWQFSKPKNESGLHHAFHGPSRAWPECSNSGIPPD